MFCGRCRAMRRFRDNRAQLLQRFLPLIPTEKDRLSCLTLGTLVDEHALLVADRFYADNFHHFKVAALALRGSAFYTQHVCAPFIQGLVRRKSVEQHGPLGMVPRLANSALAPWGGAGRSLKMREPG